MRIVQHVDHLIFTIFRIRVRHIGALRRSAITEIPNHIIIYPTRDGVELNVSIGAKHMVIRDFLVMHTINGHVILHLGNKAVGLNKHARIHKVITHITNRHFDMVFRHRLHFERHCQQYRKTVKLNGQSMCIVDIVFRVVVWVDIVNADRQLRTRYQSHVLAYI